MKIRAVKTNVVHEMGTERLTLCGRPLTQFKRGVVPVGDQEPVTCGHCKGEVLYFGGKKKRGW